ncbi:hypothetical protein ACFVFN_36600, partial [Streptomyces pharetrae]
PGRRPPPAGPAGPGARELVGPVGRLTVRAAHAVGPARAASGGAAGGPVAPPVTGAKCGLGLSPTSCA